MASLLQYIQSWFLLRWFFEALKHIWFMIIWDTAAGFKSSVFYIFIFCLIIMNVIYWLEGGMVLRIVLWNERDAEIEFISCSFKASCHIYLWKIIIHFFLLFFRTILLSTLIFQIFQIRICWFCALSILRYFHQFIHQIISSVSFLHRTQICLFINSIRVLLNEIVYIKWHFLK